MFLGTFEHTLDTKNRFVVPAKVRSQLGDAIVVSKGFEGCLELRSEQEFAKFAERLSSFPETKKATRVVMRQLLGNAADLAIDTIGRVLLPSTLLAEAGITKQICIIGVGSKYEIWDKARYEQQKLQSDQTFEQLAEGLGEDE